MQQKCIFLGYETDGEFGYKLWDPENRRLIRSSDVVFNEDSILSRNQQKIVGKRVSFEIAKDNVEGSAHRTEENEVQTYPDTDDCPLAQLEEKVIKDKVKSTHVEKGNNAIKRVGTDTVDPTNTSKAKGRSRNESTMNNDLQHGGMTMHCRNPTHGARHPTKLLMMVPNILTSRHSWSTNMDQPQRYSGDPDEHECRHSSINQALTTSTTWTQANQNPRRKP